MLQPMQPMGQQQKPGTNIGMPKAPGQQTMPAGAAMQRGILPGGIASNPEDIKAAYGGTPQGQQKLQQSAQQGDYLSAIALAQILEEERERAAAKSMPQEGGKPAPVVDRMRDEAVELRRQDLEEQQAKRLGMEQQRSQGAMAQMIQQAARPPMQGIAQLPAPNVAQPKAMAAGGIIAFDDGGKVVEKVTEEEVRPVGANPYAGMPARKILQMKSTELVGADRDEAERRKREEYMKFAGYTPEEKARQEKRIAEMEAYDRQAYAPERLQNEGLAAFLMGAANTGGIGETLARAGQSGLNYSNKMRELARQRMENRQKQAEAWDEAQRGVRVKGFEAGAAEGKENLAGMRAGLGGLGDIVQADTSAANAAIRAGGSGAGNKALEDASQAVARDRQILEISKYMRDNSLEPGTAEYNKYAKMIEDRERAIYAGFKVPYPEYPQSESPVAEHKKEEGSIWSGLGNLIKNIGGGAQKLQSGQAQKDIPIQPAKTKAQMVVGQMYNTAKGPARWNGTDYEQ